MLQDEIPTGLESRRNEPGADRRSRDAGAWAPLGDRTAWTAYVEARDRYREVAATRPDDFAAMTEAREDMDEAYLRWSRS